MRQLTAADGPAARQLELQLILQSQTVSMARGERILEASATLGPLLGLLGTVTGLIRTFAALGCEVGSASMDRVALGISEVLISTATGILVARFISDGFQLPVKALKESAIMGAPWISCARQRCYSYLQPTADPAVAPQDPRSPAAPGFW